MCQITSQPYDAKAIELREPDFATGSLQRISYIRPGKLFTANESIFQRAVGSLIPPTLFTVRERVIKTIRGDDQ